MIVRKERIGAPYFRRGRWWALYRLTTRVERPIIRRLEGQFSGAEDRSGYLAGEVIGHQVEWDWHVRDLPYEEKESEHGDKKE